MAKFKEIVRKPFRAIIDNPTVKKVSENKVVTKVALPVTTSAVGASLTIKRIHDMKKQHEEEMAEYKKLADKIDDMSEKLDKQQEKDKKKKKKRSVFKKKEFSVEGGGFGKPSPRSIESEGLKRIAECSKYRSLEESEQSLLEAVKKFGDENCTVGQKPHDSFARMSAYQKGDVVVFMFKYLGTTDMGKLSSILDAYCRTFRNADYSSEMSSSGTGFIELWVAENSLEYLVKQLITNGFSINVVL